MKFEFFPDEIITALANMAGLDIIENKTMIENAAGSLYDLKAICENPYNADYHKDFYKLLERVTEEYNRK